MAGEGETAKDGAERPPAKTKPVWVDYVDLGLKAIVPIVVLSATACVNGALENRRQEQACLDSQMSLIEFVCKDKDASCVISPERASHVADVLRLTTTRCDAVGQKVPTPLIKIAKAGAASSGDVDAVADVSKAAKEAQSTPEAAKPDPRSPPRIEPAQTGAPPPAGLPPRIYLQIKSESQRPAANQLRTALSSATIEGRKVSAPGVELRSNSGVTTTQLRCMTRSDCQAAPALAAYLGALLSTPPIPIRDFSARYEGATSARPLHYELWFNDEPIKLSSAVSTAPSPSAGGSD